MTVFVRTTHRVSTVVEFEPPLVISRRQGIGDVAIDKVVLCTDVVEGSGSAGSPYISRTVSGHNVLKNGAQGARRKDLYTYGYKFDEDTQRVFDDAIQSARDEIVAKVEELRG